MIRRIKSLAVILSVLLLTSCSYTNIVSGLLAVYDSFNTADSSVSTESSLAEAPSYKSSSSAASSDPSNRIQPHVATMNCGLSKTFDGTCLLINVFLSDGESSFNTVEKTRAMAHLSHAVNYLERQAKSYDKDLSIIYKESDLMLNCEMNSEIPTDLDDYMWIFTVVQKIHAQKSIDSIMEKYGAENVSFIFHVDKTGRSYARMQNHKSDAFYDDEIAVVFSSDVAADNGVYDTTSYVYAHEILHLFGAIDLYYPFNPDDERIKLAEARFPDDIMLVYAYDINSAFISNVDAYLIGWCDYLEEENQVFIVEPYE